MILSPYHNPPYRTPTPKASSPPPESTPKRKRTEATDSDGGSMRLDTQRHDKQSDVTGSLSPRSKVAERLRELNIERVRPAASATSQTRAQHSRPKRLKRNRGLVENSSSSDPLFGDDIIQHNSFAERAENRAINEVSETPDCRSRPRTPPPAKRLQDPRQVSEESPSIEEEIRVSAPQLVPPRPSPLFSTPARSELIIERSVSPLPLREELTSDQAALTWQDDEITGHELDPSGDDDGEGINGIGFKPTPAIAFARQLKRKQQVNEWRAREAREARQKRFNRRRGTAFEAVETQDDAASTVARRMVRFVG